MQPCNLVTSRSWNVLRRSGQVRMDRLNFPGSSRSKSMIRLYCFWFTKLSTWSRLCPTCTLQNIHGKFSFWWQNRVKPHWLNMTWPSRKSSRTLIPSYLKLALQKLQSLIKNIKSQIHKVTSRWSAISKSLLGGWNSAVVHSLILEKSSSPETFVSCKAATMSCRKPHVTWHRSHDSNSLWPGPCLWLWLQQQLRL